MKTFLLLADVSERAPASGAPLMLKVIFWILLLLWLIGGLTWGAAPTPNPNWQRGNSILLIVLFAILGYYTFGF